MQWRRICTTMRAAGVTGRVVLARFTKRSVYQVMVKWRKIARDKIKFLTRVQCCGCMKTLWCHRCVLRV